jgi:sugar phosphate permease
VMDIGGRQTSGFAMGIIDCFQYIGSTLAGFALGGIITHYGWNAYFLAMLPFSALGFLLMLGVWLGTRGRDVRGA